MLKSKTIIKIMLTFVSLLAISLVIFKYFQQPKIYQSFHTDTDYTFIFYNDSTYKVVINGHHGHFDVQGKYKINKDTIQLMNFERFNGDSNGKYLMLGDSAIIDLTYFWDYKIMWNNEHNHSGRERFEFFKKPNLDTLVEVDKQEFEAIVQQCTNFLTQKVEFDVFHSPYIDSTHLHTGILRLLNTFKTNQNSSFEKEIFKSAKFIEFLKVIKEKDYEKLAHKGYFGWIPCKDGGYYSRYLKIEFGGEIHPYSKYTIKK